MVTTSTASHNGPEKVKKKLVTASNPEAFEKLCVMYPLSSLKLSSVQERNKNKFSGTMETDGISICMSYFETLVCIERRDACSMLKYVKSKTSW